MIVEILFDRRLQFFGYLPPLPRRENKCPPVPFDLGHQASIGIPAHEGSIELGIVLEYLPPLDAGLVEILQPATLDRDQVRDAQIVERLNLFVAILLDVGKRAVVVGEKVWGREVNGIEILRFDGRAE
jgi:hypothetical protein